MSSITLVTGASRGIGAASALAAARAGHDVVVNYALDAVAAGHVAEPQTHGALTISKLQR